LKVLGIDQSLSKCAFVQLTDGVVGDMYISKTGSAGVKVKRPDTSYYPKLSEQIHQICEDLRRQVNNYQPDIIVFESLSYGSVGDASRNLAELHGALMETLICMDFKGKVSEVAPTSLKSYAHQYLHEDLRWDGLTKAKKPKKVKMDKKLMVSAVRELFGLDYLKGYNYSSGLDDLADATFLAHKIWKEHGEAQK